LYIVQSISGSVVLRNWDMAVEVCKCKMLSFLDSCSGWWYGTPEAGTLA
jgi:hypothetical protein